MEIKNFGNILSICDKQCKKNAIIFEDKNVSYEFLKTKLNEEIKIDENNLKIGFLLDNSENIIIQFLRVILTQNIPVMLDSSWNKETLEEILKKLNIDYILTNDKFSKIKKEHYKKKVSKIDVFEPLYIGFTSGTTTIPKNSKILDFQF